MKKTALAIATAVAIFLGVLVEVAAPAPDHVNWGAAPSHTHTAIHYATPAGRAIADTSPDGPGNHVNWG